ncbi:DUF1002 domain-containing protein [Barrientosiimonas marina]|uniref:DUF1002 domain-containing protein n=1 Tax=Lentibacillus kimchii TaxID=1542911 RepID=A0ABW2UZY5_9BACI
MSRFLKSALTFLILACFAVTFTAPVQAAENDNTEKSDAPIVVYGDALSDAQKQNTTKLLEIKDPEAVEAYTVTGEDIANYIDGNPNSNMFSSVKITREDEGKGIDINIVTPENITEVSNEMYANALLTAGVENASVDVASPAQVTGTSALTGIYKAYDAKGEELDKERMELANDELDVATDLADKEGMNKEKVTELLTDIKQEIADKNPATKEEVQEIVDQKLDDLEISLSDEDRQLLIDLINKMRDLNIDFDKIEDQLGDIANKVKDLVNDDGFWNRVQTFFSNMLDKITGFFGAALY